MDDPELQLKLAQDYTYLLSTIKPLVDLLDNKTDVELCLLWLSRLDQYNEWEHGERNLLLAELCKQVRNKCISSPFTTGLADDVELDSYESFKYESETDNTDGENQFAQYAVSDVKNKIGLYSCNRAAEQDEIVQDIDVLLTQQKANLEALNNDRLNQMKHFYETKLEALTNSLKIKQQEKIKLQQALKLQTNARCDGKHLVSEYKDMQIENENLCKNNEILMENNEKLKMKNEKLIQELKESNDILTKYKNKFVFVTKYNNRLMIKNKELINLKKHLMKENEDMSKLITDLNNRVRHLQSDVQKLSKQLESVQLTADTKLNHSDCKLKETESDCRDWQKQVVELMQENEILSNKAEELEGDLISVKKKLDEKDLEVKSMRKKLEGNLEQEIVKFKQELLTNYEVNEDRKVKQLKNKVKQLEGSLVNLRNLSEARLQQYKSVKDIEMTKLAVDLKTQDNETTNQIENKYQNEINKLEEQYKKLLTEAECEATKQMILDREKIRELENKLISAGINITPHF